MQLGSKGKAPYCGSEVLIKKAEWSRKGFLKSSHRSEAFEDLHQQTLPDRLARRARAEASAGAAPG